MHIVFIVYKIASSSEIIRKNNENKSTQHFFVVYRIYYSFSCGVNIELLLKNRHLWLEIEFKNSVIILSYIF